MPFDHTKYTQRPGPNGLAPTEQLASPHSDAYANMGFVISFYHMITGKELRFKAFLTALNETYTPDYASEQVFGRMDPIHTYKGTSRAISLGFKIPAASLSEAYENLAKTQTLIQMQYPAYTDVQNALTIAQAPLIRIKVMNIISDARHYTQVNQGFPYDIYDSYKTEDNAQYGLLGIIDSLTIDHQLANDEIGVFEKANNTLLPKSIEVNLNFKPLHEHTGGWKVGKNGLFDFAEQSFPYGTTDAGGSGVAQETYIPSNPTRAEQDSQVSEVSDTMVAFNNYEMGEALGMEYDGGSFTTEDLGEALGYLRGE